ncbi:MAG TPA: hypothetical protein VLQ48_17425 [Chloroflexia bacterium]|nr:hypothetical protein [Chloroflexia bacterium]
MGVEQPGTNGKIGNLVALVGIFLCIGPLVNLFYHSLSPFNISLLAAIVVITIGYLIARNDPYVKQSWWRLLVWNPRNTIERAAQTLVLYGYTSAWVMLFAADIPLSDLGPLQWTFLCVAVIAVIMGFALVLTAPEVSSPAQEHNSDLSAP